MGCILKSSHADVFWCLAELKLSQSCREKKKMFARIKMYKMMMNSSVSALRTIITHLSVVVLTTGKSF